MRFIPLYMLLILALVACGGEEPPPPSPPPAETEMQPEPDVDDPEVATRDEAEDVDEVRERRDRLREEMREHRQTAAEGEIDQRPRGEAEPETDWWHDETVVAELGLDEQQLLAIEEAATLRRETRDDGRRQMVELRRQLSRDLAEEAEEETADLRAQRDELRERLDAADRDWRGAVEEILDPTQLEQLEASDPDALSPRLRRDIEEEAEEVLDEEPDSPVD